MQSANKIRDLKLWDSVVTCRIHCRSIELVLLGSWVGPRQASCMHLKLLHVYSKTMWTSCYLTFLWCENIWPSYFMLNIYDQQIVMNEPANWIIRFKIPCALSDLWSVPLAAAKLSNALSLCLLLSTAIILSAWAYCLIQARWCHFLHKQVRLPLEGPYQLSVSCECSSGSWVHLGDPPSPAQINSV